MRQKIIGAGIAAVLVSLAAVGAFASQDGLNLLVLPTDTPTATPVSTDTPIATDTPSATDTPAATGTPAATDTPAATSTPGPSETATPTGTPAATDTPSATDTPAPSTTPDDRGVHGIPTTNPSHRPEDGDGVCQRGETIVKTTPSGNKVTVPCQTAKHGEGHGNPGNGRGH